MFCVLVAQIHTVLSSAKAGHDRLFKQYSSSKDINNATLSKKNTFAVVFKETNYTYQLLIKLI